MTAERTEELLINSIEWAVNISEQATHDIIRAIGITSDELDAIGYDKENFSNMHTWIK